jgi:hypothetical protein
MLQRIQTVYLLFVAGLFIALLFLPLAVVKSGNTEYSFNVFGLNTVAPPYELVFSTWPLLFLTAVISILSLIIIFMYKKRILQMRISVFNSLLIIGLCCMFGFYFWQFKKSPELPDMILNIKVWTAFPIVSLIFNYLAIRSIGIDEALVRSLNRLR